MKPDATRGETPDQWYEREKSAFIAWWESEGQKKFGATPTLAAGAGWLARAEAASTASERVMPSKREELLADALRHILWIKDCGIDGTDEHGVFRNWPETERDSMYVVAKEALEATPSATRPKMTLSEFVNADKETRETIGTEVVKGAIARQNQQSDKHERKYPCPICNGTGTQTGDAPGLIIPCGPCAGVGYMMPYATPSATRTNEPTEEMIQAAIKAGPINDNEIARITIRRMWKAMLALYVGGSR